MNKSMLIDTDPEYIEVVWYRGGRAWESTFFVYDERINRWIVIGSI